MSSVLEVLLKKGLIQTAEPKPTTEPIPPRVNTSKFHQRYGHDTDYCFTLRNKIQDLIDNGIISKPGPNVTSNPLPPHHTVNMLEVNDSYFDPIV